MSEIFKRFVWIFAAVGALMLMWRVPATGKSALADPRSAIQSVLESQAAAWNSGNLDAFMEPYLNSPETSYVSADSEVYGYDALKQRYQNRYGTHTDTMGKLDFNGLKISPISNTSALCIGHWHLVRAGKPDVAGIFSLVFVRKNGAWKIMHDHTSVTPTP